MLGNDVLENMNSLILQNLNTCWSLLTVTNNYNLLKLK